MDSTSGKEIEPTIVLLFTTFPVLSETFLQREVEVFSRSGVPLRLVSLWGGQSSWKGLPVERFGLGRALSALLYLPGWCFRKPEAIRAMIAMIWRPRASGLLNWGENLLGLAYALVHASSMREREVRELHAVWASAPAMAALGLHILAGIPFSFGAHAYDLFERGGDGWIREKIARARWIRSSTRTGVARLRDMGAKESSLRMVRRGLPDMPPFAIREREQGAPFRLLTVGRMVEKMGHRRLLPCFRQLREMGVEFEVTWIGDGPLRPMLEKAVVEEGLKEIVNFRGGQPYDEVSRAYREQDLLLFSGVVDSRGDRAGLPNVIPEAMAHGLPVLATRVGAVEEAIEDGVNGWLWPGDPEARTLLAALQSDRRTEIIRAGREWVEEFYDLNRNLLVLLQEWHSVCGKSDE